MLRAAAGAEVDVYLTSSAYRGEAPQLVALSELDAGQVDYLGGQNPTQLLAQFEELRGEKTYDAAIVLTDGSGYELGQSNYTLSVTDFPVWLVHLENEIPIGYDDQTLAALQGSQGGVSGSLQEALLRIAAGLAGASIDGDSKATLDLVDGYVWQTSAAEPGISTLNPSDGFAALAARRVILAEMQRQRGELDDPETLDALHALAQEQSIVTPYSSMIVLVTVPQKDLLERLSELDDRYQREVEALGETTPATQTPLTGVPEPEEWLLIGLALAMAAYVWLSRNPRQLQKITASLHAQGFLSETGRKGMKR
jgi:putative PEP-CTERM system integral membrane protein